MAISIWNSVIGNLALRGVAISIEIKTRGRSETASSIHNSGLHTRIHIEIVSSVPSQEAVNAENKSLILRKK